MEGIGCSFPLTPSKASRAIRAELRPARVRKHPHAPPWRKRVDPCDAHLKDLETAYPQGVPVVDEVVVRFV